MRTSVRRFLPGFPSVLLVPPILTIFIVLCWVPHKHGGPGAVAGVGYHRGFPAAFEFSNKVDVNGDAIFDLEISDFWVDLLLIDIAFALVVTYVVVMGVDRIALPIVRKLRATEPEV